MLIHMTYAVHALTYQIAKSAGCHVIMWQLSMPRVATCRGWVSAGPGGRSIRDEPPGPPRCGCREESPTGPGVCVFRAVSVCPQVLPRGAHATYEYPGCRCGTRRLWGQDGLWEQVNDRHPIVVCGRNWNKKCSPISISSSGAGLMSNQLIKWRSFFVEWHGYF